MALRALFVLALALAVGCSYHVWSPPAHTVPLEGVGSLDSGEVRLAGRGTRHTPLQALDDQPDGAGGGLGMAIGLGDDLDLRLGAQVLHLSGGGVTDLDRNVWSGRAAVRWAPERWVALSVGAGAGTSAAGAFVSPDIGVTLGDGSEWVGFFCDLRLSASLPVDPRTLDLAQPNDDSPRLATPSLTAILQVTPGMRFTLLSRERSDVGLVLRISPNVTMVADAEQVAVWIGGGIGVEVAFDGAMPPRS